ncbi:MAG: very short patch repair endonuclease [Alphaproteobacteria bacterium]
MRPPRPDDLKRSTLMSRVRQRGTAAERRVATALRAAGHAYRLNVRSLPGSPDFANRKRRWVVFVNGCFWHRHTGCRRGTVPKANAAFWHEKFEANRKRDARAIRALRRAGYRVIVVWECEAADGDTLRSRLSKVLEARRVDVSLTVDH